MKIYGKEKSTKEGQEETSKESKTQEEGHKEEKQAMCGKDESRQAVQEVCVGSRQVLLLTQEIVGLPSTYRFFLSYNPPHYLGMISSRPLQSTGL